MCKKMVQVRWMWGAPVVGGKEVWLDGEGAFLREGEGMWS